MDSYAIIGHPVKHSLSPKIHLAFAKQTGIQLKYTAIEAPLDGFKETVLQFRDNGGKGCNITAPFKIDAFTLATAVSPNAKIAYAANCLAFLDDKTIFADNFDGAGLVADLLQHKNFNLTQQKILIIGAGGATQGILAPLLENMPHSILIANRTLDKAVELAKRFDHLGMVQGIALDKLQGGNFNLIIHATSLGHRQQIPALPEGLIDATTVCYDLSYGAAAKPFLHWAKNQGGQLCYDGLGMLIEQAALSFNLWHGIYPETPKILKMLEAEIQKI